MSSLLKNIIRFALFILFQAYVLDKVHPLHEFIKPYLYFLFILWLPFNVSRGFLLIIAFIFGLCMDYFSGTPGVHIAPCLLIAFLRPYLISILLPQEVNEVSYAEPSFKSMGGAPYSVYVIILTFVHHATLVLIEWMSFGNFLLFIGKVAGSTAISLLLIFITEMLFYRKGKYRTNAA